jgi:predicted nucleic acid-binding protein
MNADPNTRLSTPIRVLVDTNVVLDALLAREPWASEAQPVYAARDDGRVELCLLASTVTDVYYIVRKQAGREKARESVATCLQVYTILAVSREVIERALARMGVDFEDDVQIAAADMEQVTYLMTRNVSDFAASPIPALTPLELATLLQTP